MRFIYTDYMPNQFSILPAIGVIKKAERHISLPLPP